MGKRILTMLLVAMFCVGCQSNQKTVSLKYSIESISNIELVYDKSYYESDDWEVLCELASDDVGKFVEELCGIHVKKPWNPGGSLGYLFVRIQYSSGEQELIGTEAYEYISSSGESKFDGWHNISYDDMYNLFSEYVEDAELPSL